MLFLVFASNETNSDDRIFMKAHTDFYLPLIYEFWVPLTPSDFAEESRSAE